MSGTPEEGGAVEGFAPGARIGKYEVIGTIGRGGMGAVFRCRHRTLGTEVAVKVISLPDLVDVGQEDRAATTRRFLREARAAAQIRHENMVAVLDVDEEGGRQYMVMELVDGVSAREYLDGGPVDPREAARIGLEVARVLTAAHTAGVVHRDVKPENILLSRDGRVKLGDFGIAAVATHEGEDSAKLTRTGVVVGTPHYISPEQVNGEKIDARADLYSLGASLYHLVTGTLPFTGRSGYEVCVKHVTEPAAPPSKRVAGVPAALDAVVLRLMAKAPAERMQTAGEVVDSLERFLKETEPVPPGSVIPPSREPPAPGWAPWPVEAAPPPKAPAPAAPAPEPRAPASALPSVIAAPPPSRFPWLALVTLGPLLAIVMYASGIYMGLLPRGAGTGATAGASTAASASASSARPPVRIDPDAMPQEVLFQGMKLAETDPESARYVLAHVTSTPGADATTRALAYYHLVGVLDRLGRKAEGDDAAASFLSLQDGLPRALVDAASAERLRARLR